MSRSGYVETLSMSQLALYRGTVERSIRGKRGQALLRDLRAAMEAMPEGERRLAACTFESETGDICPLTCVARRRGIDMSEWANRRDEDLDEADRENLGEMLDISPQMAAEVMFMNDEASGHSPEARWSSMHAWVLDNLLPEKTT